MIAPLLSLLLAAPRAPAPVAGVPPAQATAASSPAPAVRIVTLDEATEAARRNQPQILQARAAAEAAAARADEARAALLPQVTASGSYARTTNNAPGMAMSWSTGNSWSAGASASQLLWDFGQSSGTWRAARESAAAQRESERATSAQVLYGVRSAYFAARAARDLVQVAQDSLANQEAHLAQIQAFVEVGTRPEIDLAQARTNVANAQVQLIQAVNGYASAKAQLNQAMGIEGATDYEVASDTLPAVPGEDAPLDALVEEAVGARPELASLDRLVRSQRAILSSTRGAYFPQLGVATDLGGAGPTFPRSTWNWDAKATLTWDLFSGGLTNAKLREARANLTGLEAQASAERQQVRLEVDQARLAVRASKTSLDAAGQAVVNAKEQLRLAEGRYKAGAGSSLELSDAQVAYTSAAAQQVQAQYTLSSARAQLLKALGR